MYFCKKQFKYNDMKNYENLKKQIINENTNGIDEVQGIPVATNEEGWTLIRFESNLFDTFVCLETVSEMFPNYEFPEDNTGFCYGYILEKDGEIYYEV